MMMMMMCLISLLMIISSVYAGTCPNDCSSHGTCTGQTCACFTGWEELPDCSKRGCPSDKAWFSKPTETDAHHVMECSNNGFCDSQKGSCKCFDGFSGSSCQRRSCPNDCSGHGQCISMNRLASIYDVTYTNWETDTFLVCSCDHGYSGPDCSYSLCPRGDNPKTTTDVDVQIRVSVSATTSLAGQVALSFQNVWSKFTANGNSVGTFFF